MSPSVAPTHAPLVSVIVPACNSRTTIGTAIASVLSGTYENIQVVVCDDASTDDTSATVVALSDPRISLLRNAHNLGPGASRERAIAASDGDWLTFLDADDAWTPDRLTRLLGAADEQQDVIVFDDIMLCHHTRHGLKPWRRLHGPHAFGACKGAPSDVTLAQWASARQFVMQPLIPMAALHASGVHHSNRRFQEDTEFILRLVATGLSLRYVPQACYLYRITPGSLSGARNPGRLTRQMLEEVLPLFDHEPDMTGVLEQKIAYRYFTEAIKTHELLHATRIAAHNPRLVMELMKRSIGSVRYQTSRIIHGAEGR